MTEERPPTEPCPGDAVTRRGYEAIFPNAVNSANQLNSRTRDDGGKTGACEKKGSEKRDDELKVEITHRVICMRSKRLARSRIR